MIAIASPRDGLPNRHPNRSAACRRGVPSHRELGEAQLSDRECERELPRCRRRERAHHTRREDRQCVRRLDPGRKGQRAARQVRLLPRDGEWDVQATTVRTSCSDLTSQKRKGGQVSMLTVHAVVTGYGAVPARVLDASSVPEAQSQRRQTTRHPKQVRQVGTKTDHWLLMRWLQLVADGSNTASISWTSRPR